MTLLNWLWTRSNNVTSTLRPRTRLGVHQLESREVPSAAFASVLGIGNDTTAVVARSNAVDADGYTYVTGLLYAQGGPVDFDPLVDRPDGSDLLAARGTSDAFVAKYAPDNTLVWARRMGGDYIWTTANDPFEGGDAVAVDGAGNVYVSGDMVGTGDFGSVKLTSAGSADGFVAKLDPNGEVLWANQWGTSSREFGNRLAVDPTGNILAVGFTTSLSSNGAWMATGSEVRKYAPTGALVWNKQIASRGMTTEGVATDAAGNAYVCGNFAGKVDFNPAANKTYYVTGASTVSSGSGVNGYVLKLTAAGAFGWVSPFIAKTAEDANARVGCWDVAVDSTGSVVVGGNYRGPADFNPSATVEYRLPTDSSGAYVAKLSSAGGLTWAVPLSGAQLWDLTLDTAGSVYITGSFSGTYTAPGTLPVTTAGSDDVYVTKLTAGGSVAWSTTFGGTSSDIAWGVAVGKDGAVYVCGQYSGTVDFDPGEGVSELTNPARADLFLVKLRQN